MPVAGKAGNQADQKTRAVAEVNPYLNAKHMAFRLLGMPSERFEWMQLLTKVMQHHPSAILYPEQMIVNKHFFKPHINEPAIPTFKIFAVEFSTHASATVARVCHHSFNNVKLRDLSYTSGRASHVPSTLLRWDMEKDTINPEIKVHNNIFTSGPLHLGTYLPWIRATNINNGAGRGGEVNTLFADREDAYDFAGRLMREAAKTEFQPPSYMRARELLEALV